jgi:hypothetical protein
MTTASATPVGTGHRRRFLRVVVAWFIGGFVLPVAAAMLWVRYATPAGEWGWVYLALALISGAWICGPAAVYWSLRRVSDDLAGRTALLTLVGLVLTVIAGSVISAAGVAVVAVFMFTFAPPTIGRLLALQSRGETAKA